MTARACSKQESVENLAVCSLLALVSSAAHLFLHLLTDLHLVKHLKEFGAGLVDGADDGPSPHRQRTQ